MTETCEGFTLEAIQESMSRKSEPKPKDEGKSKSRKAGVWVRRTPKPKA